MRSDKKFQSNALQSLAYAGFAAAILLLLTYLPAVVLRQSEQPQILGLYSRRYFGFLLSYFLQIGLLISAAVFFLRGQRSSRQSKALARWETWIPWLTTAGLTFAWAAWWILRGAFLDAISPTLGRGMAIALIAWSAAQLAVFGLRNAGLAARRAPGKIRAWLIALDDRSAPARTRTGFGWLDVAYIVFCILLAGVLLIGYWRNLNPFVFLGSDAANISGFVAGRAHPDLFVQDPLLGHPENYEVYLTIHIPLITWMGQALGNYGQPWAYLFAPVFLIQLIGFYLLGVAFFRDRIWAILFSLATAAFTYMNLGEFWGVGHDAIPRLFFQALLPYLLTLQQRWQDRPARWPVLMALCGALVYFHPVSTPAWGVAVWLALWVGIPRAWPLSRRLLWMGLSGLAFVAAVIPFAVHYLNNYAHGQVTDYSQVIEIMRFRFAPGFLDIPVGLADFARLMLSRYLPLSLLAVSGGIAALGLARKQDGDRKNLTFLAWLGGVLFVSVALPLIDHGLAGLRGELPLEVDLIRGLRYLFPLALLIGLRGLQQLGELIRSRSDNFRPAAHLAPLGLGILFSLLWLVQFPVAPVQAAAQCWRSGAFFCPLSIEESQQLEALNMLREETAPGSVIMTTDLALEIRFYSLRAVAYSRKDGGVLGYSSPQALMTWYDTTLDYNRIMDLDSGRERLSQLIDLGISLEADYLLVDWFVPPADLAVLPAGLVGQNQGYTLLDLRAIPAR